MPTARLALAGMVAGLLVAPMATQPASGAAAAPVRSAEVRTVAVDRKKDTFQPAVGVTFNDPATFGSRRVIIGKIIRSIENTHKGEKIRVVTWNFDDKPATNALIAADKRGVKVQVIVSGLVANPNWRHLRQALNRNKHDTSFAMRCTGGCRSRVKIMHSKFYMFSRVHRARHITMIGSSNLTTPAGNRQWNDLVTTASRKVYSYMADVFGDYKKDKILKDPYKVKTLGDYRIWIYPVGHRNPQVSQLKKVRCHGATGRTGTHGRTKIRIAVAGWFDAYGDDIAKRVRRLWDHGCDVRIVTTLAGRGVNRTLKAGGGRGPVPVRELAVDRNFDGVPERYLHQKSVAISGVFGKDTSASVVLTGSPNWSERASHSEEVWLRILGHKAMTARYLARVDRMFASPFSHPRLTTRSELRQAVQARARTVGAVLPEWLELD